MTCYRCGGLGFEGRRCGVCGAGECTACRQRTCLRDDLHRSSAHPFGAITIEVCGRYLKGGEFVAVSGGFAFCRPCYYSATTAGVPEAVFEHGDLIRCIPCGYHTARIKPWVGTFVLLRSAAGALRRYKRGQHIADRIDAYVVAER